MSETRSDRNTHLHFSRDRLKSAGRAQLSVVLVYPNSYAVGMDNLGFQGMYGLLISDPRVHCERAFWEDDARRLPSGRAPRSSGTGLRSSESKLHLKSFDVVAFSISFENDYVNVLRILKAAGIEPFSSKRGERPPLLLAGGVGVFVNPEPMSPFMDAIFLGEADEAVEDILDALVRIRADGKERVIESLSEVDGMYVPSVHSPFLGGQGKSRRPGIVKRRYVSDLSSAFRSSVISTSRSHLAGMLLVESGRGCTRKCRFCAVTSAYSPVRFVPADTLLARIEETAPARGTVGIVGACVSEHPKLTELVKTLVAKGLRVSLSSVRADSASAELMQLIAQSGTRTITIAPEAGTARLRKIINKDLEEQRLMEMVEIARLSNIVSLKLYFMIGLPGEREEDIEAIVSLAAAIRSTFVSGNRNRRVTVSVSPFVPKAFTPFQWCRMPERGTLDARMRTLARGFSRMKGVKFSGQSVRGSILEGALSRGDWRVAQALYGMVYENLNPKKAWSDAGLNLETGALDEQDATQPLPWEHLIVGPSREELEEELNKALSQA